MPGDALVTMIAPLLPKGIAAACWQDIWIAQSGFVKLDGS